MDVYSVAPESVSPHETFSDSYRTRLGAAARDSERAGWTGILVPHNLHEVDPWLLAGYLGAVTDTLIPLLAVQPACMPPHTAAATAAAYAMLYDRPLYFNLVAGARDDEMRRIGDRLSHDERYERLRQYGRILKALLRGDVVDESSEYYDYQAFRLEPRPEVLTQCKIFVAGSSPASLRVALDVADVVVTHPAPFADWRDDFLAPLLASGYSGEIGIRIGMICRPDRDEAWEIAARRFPESWQGRQETLLKTHSQNAWSRDLAVRSMTAEAADEHRETYWLGAFRSGRASAPFLVGGHGEVRARLAEYAGAGVRHVLLNGSYEDDFADIRESINVDS